MGMTSMVGYDVLKGKVQSLMGVRRQLSPSAPHALLLRSGRLITVCRPAATLPPFWGQQMQQEVSLLSLPLSIALRVPAL